MCWLVLAIVAALATVSCEAQTSPAGMVFVRGGSFDMGVAKGADNPLHRVQVDDFWMARYEVTAGEWRVFTERIDGMERWGQFWFSQIVGKGTSFQVPDDWAMFSLTWYEAVWYCNWRSQEEGLQPAYSYDEAEMHELLFGHGRAVSVEWNRDADGYRLPTEAEWEYAARGGAEGRGRAYPEGAGLADIAWFKDNSGREVHPVGQKQPNVLGLYDMLGNVGEWCWDYYRPDFYAQSPRQNPAGPESGYDPRNFAADVREIRVIRGSTWMHTLEYSSEVFRFRSVPTLMNAIGIRLVRSAR